MFGLQSTIEESQSRQELQQEAGLEPETETMGQLWLFTDSLPGSSLISFLIQPKSTCLGKAPPTVGWVFLHQLAIQKITHRCGLETVSQPELPLPGCVRLT